jgi:hypothetical protein
MTAPEETRAERKARLAASNAAMAPLPLAGRKAVRRKHREEISGVVFDALRIKVRDGQVTAWPGSGRVLGALAGARAEVTAGARNRATAFVIFTDGTIHEHKLNGALAIRRAQADAVRFGVLASAPS